MAMKGFQIFLFALFAVFAVSIARVYDEKSDAIRDIEKKFKEAKDLQISIINAIKVEHSGVNTTTGEQELLMQLLARINETKNSYEEDADAVIRTAIVQTKPVAVIYCIRNVSDKARESIVEVENSNREEIKAIKFLKYRKLNFDDYAVNAIIKGLQELKAQSIEQITNKEGQIGQLKKEAISRCESALHLLGEIEVCISEPSLPREYIKMKQQVDKALKAFRAKWGAEVEKCLNAK